MVAQLRKGAWVGRTLAALIGVAILAFAVVAVACDDDGDGGGDPTAAATAGATEPASGESAAVEAAFQAAIDAWNGGDVEAFLAAFTDAGLLEVFDATRDEAAEFLPEFIGQPPLDATIISVDVSGDTATVVADEFFGNMGNRNETLLVLQDGAWLLDSENPISGEAPEGVTLIDLTLTEYSFTFDSSQIVDGNIAFEASNAGGDVHEVALFRVPEDLDIEQAAQSEEEPEGVDEVGFVGLFDPGEGTTVIFQQPLTPGRYAMVCFVETADGQPHAALGMWGEFTIE